MKNIKNSINHRINNNIKFKTNADIKSNIWSDVAIKLNNNIWFSVTDIIFFRIKTNISNNIEIHKIKYEGYNHTPRT